MNWTEGNLARHSRGKGRNELLTKQKQHFAKVRNGPLRGRVRQSPITISFLGPQRVSDQKHRENGGSDENVSHQPPTSPLLIAERSRAQDLPDRERILRLLGKPDWVGLDLQQPINITFPQQRQTPTNPRWRRMERLRVRTTQLRGRPVHTSNSQESEAAQRPQDRKLRMQIGSREIQPSVSTASQPSTRRYSLAPYPLVDPSRRFPRSFASPEPSQARHFYVTSRSSQCSQKPMNYRNEVAREHGDTYHKTLARPRLSEEPTHIVCSSSIIHEPIPRRSGDFPILKWSPPPIEERGSMEVEVELPPEPIPLSQEVDQKRWKILVMNSSDIPPIDAPTSPLITVPSVSSKASTLPFHLQRRLPSFDFPSEPDMNSSAGCAPLSTDGLEAIEATSHEEDCPPPKKRQDHNRKEVQPMNDNDAWMKFAFDGDSEELGAEVFAKAARQVAAELVPSDTSTDSVNATETAAICGSTSFTDDRDNQDENFLAESGSESHVATHGTAASESVCSNMATAGSASVADSESRFRFVQPRTFVGKLADSGPSSTQMPPPMLGHGKRKRGRPKKRAADGRADIRRLPGFDGDPIEEFED
ncbi:uncharacterized protein F4822DRAFT_428416 [Hypoxylon trugodes]|uniref:uncharacterized protein n=1 Tax=Hypoxylon trugodes TaxID=326681 RepID=UPI0021931484|nr:uncharacterized protein F4822DRAFT_428416 [Hypoxylon trugodes]KAI1390070.1 hypothetical protein F4822DRAFT_428416 [Hypoxylon trugodes]